MSGDHEYISVVSTFPYSAQQLRTGIFLIGQKSRRMELNGTSINSSVFVLIYRLRSTVEAAATTTAGADSV